MSSRHLNFFPPSTHTSGNYFFGTRQIGPDLGDRVPEQRLHLLLRQPHDLDLRHSGHLPAHDLGGWEGVAGPPLLAEVEVVEALVLTGMPQLSPPFAHRNMRPP